MLLLSPKIFFNNNSYTWTHATKSGFSFYWLLQFGNAHKFFPHLFKNNNNTSSDITAHCARLSNSTVCFATNGLCLLLLLRAIFIVACLAGSIHFMTVLIVLGMHSYTAVSELHSGGEPRKERKQLRTYTCTDVLIVTLHSSTYSL